MKSEQLYGIRQKSIYTAEILCWIQLKRYGLRNLIYANKMQQNSFPVSS